MFAIGGDKAPGENGLSGSFFHSFQEEVGPSVFDLVKGAFLRTLDLREINKIEKPGLISQFGPISLYNLIYKCVSKVAMNRLKPFLAGVVSPF